MGIWLQRKSSFKCPLVYTFPTKFLWIEGGLRQSKKLIPFASCLPDSWRRGCLVLLRVMRMMPWNCLRMTDGPSHVARISILVCKQSAGTRRYRWTGHGLQPSHPRKCFQIMFTTTINTTGSVVLLQKFFFCWQRSLQLSTRAPRVHMHSLLVRLWRHRQTWRSM
jgi:hypothetical protein